MQIYYSYTNEYTCTGTAIDYPLKAQEEFSLFCQRRPHISRTIAIVQSFAYGASNRVGLQCLYILLHCQSYIYIYSGMVVPTSSSSLRRAFLFLLLLHLSSCLFSLLYTYGYLRMPTRMGLLYTYLANPAGEMDLIQTTLRPKKLSTHIFTK